MLKKLALCVISLALALALPAGMAFAAPSDTGNAPELNMPADTTAAKAAADAQADAQATAGDTAAQSDPAQAPATSPATGAMLIVVAAGTAVCAGGAGVAAACLRKQR